LQAEAGELPLPPDTVLTVADHDGVILVRSPGGEQWIGQRRVDPILQQVDQGDETVVEAMGVDGVKRLYAFTPLLGPNGTQVWLSIGRSPDFIDAEVRQTVLRNLFGIFAILSAALAAIWLAADRLLLRRIDNIVDASTSLAAGDWGARAPVRSYDDELDHLAVTFNSTADALQHTHQQAELSADRLARLQAVTAALSEAMTPEQVVNIIVRQVSAATGATAGAVHVLDEAGEALEIVQSVGYPPEQMQLHQRLPLTLSIPATDAVRTEQPIWLESTEDLRERYPHLALQRFTGYEGAAILPLMVEGRPLGIMALSYSEIHIFTVDQQDFVLTLASQCAQALERARLYAAEQQARLHLEERVSERTAELERSNRELNQFAYVASHDLKAPLRAIDNLSAWIAEDAALTLPPRSIEHLAKMRNRVRRMERLLDDLLAYSRAGRVQHPAEEVDLAALVQDIAGVLAPPPGFIISVEPPIPPLRTPRVSLELVLRNLIGNAIKHHQHQCGEIRVRAVEQGDKVAITVQDDGPGIDPQYHTRIFDMFQTLRPRDDVEGSGMGLAIVKKLVESYGGTIVVESEAGQGSTFCFTWPRRLER
jgi:signal transduction histidine kinase